MEAPFLGAFLSNIMGNVVRMYEVFLPFPHSPAHIFYYAASMLMLRVGE